MRSPTAPVRWSPPAPAPSPVHVAFAVLDGRQQRLVEAVLFDGGCCSELAASLGAPPSAIRSEVAGALLALQASLRPHGCAVDGAVGAMLVLRAADALDPDEAELVDAMVEQRPALARTHAEHRELVGELCAMVPPIAPSPELFERLCGSLFGDDAAAN